MTINKLLLIMVFSMSFLFPVLAQAKFGDSGNGIERTEIAFLNDVAYGLAIQPDRKLIAVGYGINSNGSPKYIAMARYKEDGTLDSEVNAFGIGGVVTASIYNESVAKCITVTANNRLILAGYTHTTKDCILLASYTSTGNVDPGFGSKGIALTSIGDSDCQAQYIAQQADKYLVAGYGYIGSKKCFALARYNSLGVLDTSFGYQGVTLTAFSAGDASASSIVVQSDGFVVTGTVGTKFGLVRYDFNGIVEKSFGYSGVVVTDFGSYSGANVLAQQSSNGYLIVGGWSYFDLGPSNDFLMARYTTMGKLDLSFNKTGYVRDGDFIDSFQSIVLQPGGKIIGIGGSVVGFCSIRYNSDGSRDGTFGSGGLAKTSIGTWQHYAYSSVLQPDGKIVVAGSSGPSGGSQHFTLLRYYSNGTLDSYDPSPTSTCTPTFTVTPTRTNSCTTTPSPTVTSSYTITPTLTETPDYSPTSTPTVTVTFTRTCTPTITPTSTLTTTITFTPTPANTPISDAEKHLRIWHSQINPMHNEQARIRWYQSDSSPVQIKVYNQLGNEIITLANGDGFIPEQINEVLWDGTNRHGVKVGSGIYLVYYSSGGHKEWTKVAVVK